MVRLLHVDSLTSEQGFGRRTRLKIKIHWCIFGGKEEKGDNMYVKRIFIVIFLFCVFSDSASMLVIGHRGACGHKPENTLSSFTKAIELGVDMIELDVWQCASGELVVFHDHKVDRMTNGTGYVTQKRLDELKVLEIQGSERIPMLEEVFDLVRRKIKICIELKGPGTAQPVAELIMRYVNTKGWSYDDFVVSSFDHYKLRECKKVCLNIRTGAHMYGLPIGFGLFAYQAGADIALINIGFVNKEFVDDIHARGMQVFVCIVNATEDAHLMKFLGVDGIMSDYPDRVNIEHTFSKFHEEYNLK